MGLSRTCNFIGDVQLRVHQQPPLLIRPAEGKFQRTATSFVSAFGNGAQRWLEGPNVRTNWKKTRGYEYAVEDAVSISGPSTTQPRCSRLPKASKEYYEMRLNKSRQKQAKQSYWTR